MTTRDHHEAPQTSNGHDTSFDRVFRAELQEIRRRRNTLGLDRSRLDTGPEVRPSPDLGLVGLALSGGGIRSATFSFGAIQALAKHHLLKSVDYLSTVSGGGYIGSCLSSVLNDPNTGSSPPAFPFSHQPGVEESGAVKHLRNSSNYLTSGRLLHKLRIPFLLLRGILTNFSILLPLIMLAVVFTEVAYALGQNQGPLYRAVLIAAMAGFLLLVVTSPFILHTFQNRFSWPQRNRYELFSSGFFLFCLVLVSLIPIVFIIVDGAIAYDLDEIREWFLDENPFDLEDLWKWIVLIAVLALFASVGKASERVSKMSGKLILSILGLLGPLILFLVYLLLCVVQIESPYLGWRLQSFHLNQVLKGERNNSVETSTKWVDDVAALRKKFDAKVGLSEDAKIDLIPGEHNEWFFADHLQFTPRAELEGCLVKLAKRPSIVNRLWLKIYMSKEAKESLTCVQNAFADQGVLLSGKVAVSEEQPGSRWSITDATYKRLYVARKTGGQLTIESPRKYVIRQGKKHLNIYVDYQRDLDARTITTDLRFAFKNIGTISKHASVDVLRRGHRWKITNAPDNTFYIWKEDDGWLKTDKRDLFARRELIFPTIALLLVLINIIFVDVNVTSPHAFYRDRLSKAYLFRMQPADGEVIANDDQKLSDLNHDGTTAPYHLINVTVNLTGSADPNIRGRNSDFFIFSKRFIGSEHPAIGFCETETMETFDRHLNLGTAMAISGAAAAPNMGTTTVRPLVFIMTLLNIRLGYWVARPAVVHKARRSKRFLLRRGPGPGYLWKEARGQLDEQCAYVNVSDGGHLENLGIYPLLRRRCQFIIAVDAEADPALQFGSLVKLIRYVRIDMGIQIDIDLSDLRISGNGFSGKHWALGKIRYSDDDIGYLLYIKSSMTGDENLYINNYKHHNPAFPHQSTADQFFDETQFEAYRSLGYHIVNRLLADEPDIGAFESFRIKTPPA